jgi:ABC-2 type transport system permease protein
MSARPGSALWLLKHELRVLWFNSAVTGKKGSGTRQVGKRWIASLALVWLLLHGGAFLALQEMPRELSQLPPTLLLFGVTFMLTGTFMLMLSGALKSSVEALFDRGDLDLLLSSPLPSRSIFVVRLLAIVATVAGTYLFFLSPVANAGAVLGQFRWLGIYPTILGFAAIATSCGMLLTLGLVRLLGARRTRVVAQVIGALAGAAMFLMSQLPNIGMRNGGLQRAQLAHWFEPGGALAHDSVLWLPAKAVLGAPLPLLGLALSAAVLVALTIYSAHRFFVHGLQQAAGIGRAAPAPAGGVRYQFGRSLAHVMLVKEWRLISRDPHLISQVLLQLLYLLPMFVLVFSSKNVPHTAIGAGFTMLSASLTASLAWIIIQAEDAPDLLLVSPAKPMFLRLVKLAAAVIPPLALLCAPLLWMTARDPVSGVLTCFTVVGAVFGACLIVMWAGRPGTRGAFNKRGSGNLLGNMLELLNTLAWAGLSYLLLTSVGRTPSDWAALGAGLLFILTLAVPLLAWLMRSRSAT